MNVRTLLELVPLLMRADPEDTVLISSSTGQLFLCNTRPGLHQSMDDLEDLHLTEHDREFLRNLGIPP
jgi:hypothetical protein